VTGKPAEALATFERELAIRRKLAAADPSVLWSQRMLAVCFGHIGGIHLEAGRYSEAATAVRESVAIPERLPILEPGDCYNLACGHAQLAGLAAMPGSRVGTSEGRAAAERAMEWLHRAVARGYRNMLTMRRDHDLDPLRSRRDFQLLMMDLAFPAEAFSKNTDADR
jgi:hypothetical protein